MHNVKKHKHNLSRSTIVQVLLFIAPGMFVGDMNHIYSRMPVLWSVTPALLRCSYGASGDSWWLKWFVLYFLAVVGIHVAMGTLCICVCVYMCVYVYIYIYIYTCVCVNICTVSGLWL